MLVIETIKAIKDYGTISICVIGLFWFNNRSNQQDAKIERIESRLFDCFEDRIKENTRVNMFGREIANIEKVYAIIPEEIKIKRA
jgi:late competence protein required for DNA uptake (superfamily II DNA/RNA helicase)